MPHLGTLLFFRPGLICTLPPNLTLCCFCLKVHVMLDHNKFSGKLQTTWMTPNLQSLIANNNEFHGPLPTVLGDQLKDLWLNNNVSNALHHVYYYCLPVHGPHLLPTTTVVLGHNPRSCKAKDAGKGVPA
jgi:hypothetical protein